MPITDPSAVRGVIPVLPCPYTDEGELALDGLRENTEFLVEFAADGDKEVMLLINGSGSEFYANTLDEQKRVIETVVDVSGDLPVIAGTGFPGTRQTVKMTQFAEASGADLAMVVPPFYHIATNEGLYRHYERVAEAVDIGIITYNNPDVSGAWIRPPLLQRISEIDNVIANKENNSVAWNSYSEARAIDPEKMGLVCGLGHSTYVSKAAMGHRYQGFVSSLGNFAPQLAYELYKTVEAGDFDAAYEILGRMDPFWEVVDEFMEPRETTSLQTPGWEANYMYLSATKVAMDLVGLNGGPVRLPMVDISEGERERVREALVEMDVLDP